ncbi:hypothetical protein GWI33_014831 [Rhynchophorus ferrugineus]|uniref:Uncharacterized protein n=1 Tax=Rhynchophorus ferrugineus TaxID=354439 RepID=A0A834I4C9_RHYFE|nr:hypothetical protein GWI33_014831 [Rhynchophorus ferrugineus]
MKSVANRVLHLSGRFNSDSARSGSNLDEWCTAQDRTSFESLPTKKNWKRQHVVGTNLHKKLPRRMQGWKI